MTIRFLLKYMSRPLHFFGGFGIFAMFVGSVMAAVLLGMKMLQSQLDLMQMHGPMFVIGSVLIVSGIQLLALGLLGELQVRHYYSSQRPASYTVDRLVRLVHRRAEPALRAPDGMRTSIELVTGKQKEQG